MKQILTYDEMTNTIGGNFVDGFCVVIGVARLFAPLLAFTGVGYVIVKTAAVGCIIYELATLD